MKTKTCLSLVAAFAASALVAATPVIKADSVTFSQNSTTRLVTIGYTLEETNAVVTVDVQTNNANGGWASIGASRPATTSSCGIRAHRGRTTCSRTTRCPWRCARGT